MKLIKLTESQFNKLIKETYLDPSSDMKEYKPSEVSSTSNVVNQSGDLEYGEEPTLDKITSGMTNQNWYLGGVHNRNFQR